jgi:hypothetical protein
LCYKQNTTDDVAAVVFRLHRIYVWCLEVMEEAYPLAVPYSDSPLAGCYHLEPVPLTQSLGMVPCCELVLVESGLEAVPLAQNLWFC